MNAVMQGKKKVFTNSEIKVYKCEDNSITVQNVLSKISSKQDVLDYLPDKPEQYATKKEYLFGVVHTIDSTFLNRMI